LTSAARQAKPFVLLDNISKRLDSAALASIATADRWGDRVLGTNTITDLVALPLFIITGNALEFSPELARRAITIRLRSRVEHPENRLFKRTALSTWIKDHRREAVLHALTLISNWLAAGAAPGNESLGSFESWCAVMGGILQAAGVTGFLADRDTLRKRDDDSIAIHDFVQAWYQERGSLKGPAAELINHGDYLTNPVAASELLSVAKGTLPPSVLGGSDDHAQLTCLGIFLKNLGDQVFELDDAEKESSELNVRVVEVEIKVERRKRRGYVLSRV
jgi:hypothetical protein